jgi:hypothetical protein
MERSLQSNYRIAYDKGWQDLKLKDPADIAANMQVEYIPNKQQIIVPFLNDNYIVDLAQGTLVRASDGKFPELDAAILILHYLSFFQASAKVAGKWVSLKEIPNGGMLFYPAFHKEAICGLIRAYGRQVGVFPECAARIGGQPVKFGDVAACFPVFPKAPMCVALWEGDEEVPANATILYDPSIEYFLHIESIIGLGYYLAKRLIKLAPK